MRAPRPPDAPRPYPEAHLAHAGPVAGTELAPALGISLVAASAAAVLIVEILAARMIAPYVGMTIETMSAVIGCILGAVATGNALGGRFADRPDVRRMLARVLGAAGVVLFAAPVVVRHLGPRLSGSGPWAAAALSTAAFFVPCALASTTGPIVLAAIGRDRTRLGRIAGRVSAFGTAGALAGNFTAGHVLIANFRSDAIVNGTAAVVAGTGIALWTRPRPEPTRGRRRLTAAARTATAAGVIAGLLVAARVVDGALPCVTETKYVCLDIQRGGATGEYLVRSDAYNSSYTDTLDPRDLRLDYARAVAGAVQSTAPSPTRFLYIGAGGFTLPLYFADVFSDSAHEVIDIDGRLVTDVVDELGLDLESRAIATTIGDARVVLTRPRGAVDVIVGDAFAGQTVPWHLTTIEFAEQVRAQLAPGGVYVMNLIDARDLALARAEIRTLREVFDDVVVLAPPGAFADQRGPEELVNIVIVAGATLPSAQDIAVAATNQGSGSVAFHGAALARATESAVILRDQFAPVEQLLANA